MVTHTRIQELANNSEIENSRNKSHAKISEFTVTKLSVTSLKIGQSLGHFQRSTVDDLDPVQNTRRPAKTYLNQPLFFASVSVKKAVDYVC